MIEEKNKEKESLPEKEKRTASNVLAEFQEFASKNEINGMLVIATDGKQVITNVDGFPDVMVKIIKITFRTSPMLFPVIKQAVMEYQYEMEMDEIKKKQLKAEKEPPNKDTT